MQEQRPRGDGWITRTAAQEDTGDAQREALAAYAQSLAHIGVTPQYVGSDQLARNELGGAKVLILPHAIALSPTDVAAIRQFAAKGGLVASDVVPGTFDGHGRRLATSPLAALFSTGPGKLVAAGDQAALATVLQHAGVAPRFPARTSANDVTTYVFSGNGGTILAVQRDFGGDAAPEQIVLDLPRPMQVTDLREGKELGQLTTVTLSLDTVTPLVLRLSGTGR